MFEGAEISGPSRDRAIIFQDYSKALLPWRTVRGNVALSLEARNVPAAEDAIIDGLLVRMGLSEAKDQFPSDSPAACNSGCRLHDAWRRIRSCC